ncbi:putative orfan [Tupanvirus soda lake]|uniref:Orfan n=2 Tax=Tupanvirus TaxID=2094720 RepID=A0AC62AB99_9VIRU|nr:putative orfan [Tupanvirus soda lake]QKU35062.1 putative orfan [Tupanvirus soda lake]
MDQIIFDVVNGNNSNDELIICLIAIKRERYDIIDHLLSKGFDLNQMVLEYDSDTLTWLNFDIMTYALCKSNLNFDIMTYALCKSNLNFDIMTYALCKSNLKMIKYLVKKGAEQTKNNEQNDIFNYFLSMDLTFEVL